MNLIIIQARLGSTRLPKKILKKLGNISILEHVVQRALRSKIADKIILAIPDDLDALMIEDCVRPYPISIFKGSENDVLSRYYFATKKFNGKNIFRITSDCPLIDPLIIDAVFKKYFELGADCYLANTCPPDEASFPDGMDVEIFPLSFLNQAFHEEKDQNRKEHVTFQFWQDEKYKSFMYKSKTNYPDYRLTVDYPEDLANLNLLASKYCPNGEEMTLDQINEAIMNEKIDVLFTDKKKRNLGWK